MRPSGLLTLIVLATACAAPEEGRGTANERYQVVAGVQELMAHVVEPSAQVYWRSVGTILDREEGVIEIRPSSDEDWLAVENAAFTVAESGNLLMMNERALDDDAWMDLSRALIEIGKRAIAVAEARDEQGVFDVGAEMYYVCTQCHASYAVETLRPSDDRSTSGEDEMSDEDQDIP